MTDHTISKKVPNDFSPSNASNTFGTEDKTMEGARSDDPVHELNNDKIIMEEQNILVKYFFNI